MRCPRPDGAAARDYFAATSLKLWKYCTREAASTGWVDLTSQGPPMFPAGNVTMTSAPAATVTVCGLAPARLTVTEAPVAPGFKTWMLSPTMPGVALSNQLKYPLVIAMLGLSLMTSLNDW